jgi:phosphatidylserine decarboxylase
MSQPFSIICQHLAPQILLTRFAGFMAKIQAPWLKNLLIKFFLSRHEVNLEEAVEEDPAKYKNFHDFFTRALKPGARKIDSSNNSIASPSDGILSQFGPISDKNLIQAKGVSYSLEGLLGKNDNLVGTFKNGSFATIYLAPKHYHRVHMPIDGRLVQLRYIPGRLFSVNLKTSQHIPDLFCKNERAVLIFDTEFGKLAVIFVGAMLVGNIVTNFTGSLSPRREDELMFIDYPNTKEQHIQVKKGEEIGYFTMGSTVIMLSEQNDVNWGSSTLGQEMLLGQKLLSF